MIEDTLRFVEAGGLRERCARWLAYMEERIDYWPFGGEIHQRRHGARVLVLAMRIGREEGFSEADLEALAWAALFHDTRRRDAFIDTGHGDRGALHYRDFAREHSEVPFDPRAYLAIKWHDRPDEEGEAAFARWEREHAGQARPEWNARPSELYRAFKDADALDRLRMGEWALDRDYLRLASSKRLVGFARELLDASERVARSIYDPGCEPELRPEPWLVIVDAQTALVQGAPKPGEADAVAKRIARKLQDFPGKVVFTKTTHVAVPGSGSAFCVVGSVGWGLCSRVAAEQRERGLPVYWKPGLGSPELAGDLSRVRAKGGLSSVELVGFRTEGALAANAALAVSSLPGIPVSIDSACCAGSTAFAHVCALETLGNMGVCVR